jgi:hypothetical protein
MGSVRTHGFASRSTGFACLLALFMLIVVVQTSAAHTTTPPSAPSGAALQAHAKTRSLVALANRYAAATAADKVRLQDDLLSAAQARYEFLIQTLDEDPAAALSGLLPAGVRAGLPAMLTRYLEQDVRVEGTLEILHEDGIDGSRFRYFLESPNGRLSLHFATHAPDNVLTGAKVLVSAVQIDGMLALGGSTSVQQTAAGPLPNTFGAQRTVVLLVNFSDNPQQPYAPEEARAAIFQTTSDFFRENSYQQTWLDGNVFGWFTIPLNSATCDYASIASYAQSAATAAGVDLSNYTHRVYAFPQSACGWWGLSSVGGNPSQSWINGSFELAVLAHELGHGQGLWHAHSLDCGTTTIVASGCTSNEYGDIVDMMGASSWAHYSAFQKERLGWLNYNASPPITTVVADGTYPIEAYESTGSGPKALKILKSTDPATGQRTWYYVEFRQPIGFDSFLSEPSVGAQNVTTGVLVHTGSESGGNSAFLLDMTPATAMYYWWYDPALAVGQTFTDLDTGLAITTSWVGTTGAGVTIKLGTAVSTGSALVSVSTNQSSYTRGQTVSVSAKVTSGGSPVAKASVNFTIVKSNGSKVSASGTTGTNGTAVYKMRLAKQDPVGTYQADASASRGGQSVTAETNFTVK